ncbi:hypothetical protein KBX73_14940 [Acetobacter persici]|uniref:hypothetical protein n=1 Tax=Acetobacter persici TaxID=1076596 RepID=UPI001BA8AE6E|nr:hypothetical protein [Acetobacter persici]MBS1016871.1 hypothetical protein [Acetobacter persici]MCP9321040.1 hypothetical protein [Acetobacter persici]
MKKESNQVTVDPFDVNGTAYGVFDMRYPSYSELLLNYDAIEKSGTMDGQIAMGKLAKLCITNLKKPSDFDAFPSYAVFALCLWVGKHIA